MHAHVDRELKFVVHSSRAKYCLGRETLSGVILGKATLLNHFSSLYLPIATSRFRGKLESGPGHTTPKGGLARDDVPTSGFSIYGS